MHGLACVQNSHATNHTFLADTGARSISFNGDNLTGDHLIAATGWLPRHIEEVPRTLLVAAVFLRSGSNSWYTLHVYVFNSIEGYRIIIWACIQLNHYTCGTSTHLTFVHALQHLLQRFGRTPRATGGGVHEEGRFHCTCKSCSMCAIV